MTGLRAEMLRGIWYVAMSSRRLKIGKTEARTFLGEPMLFGRKNDGSVFALRDICPHRGVPLRYGKFDGETVQCKYHGWKFGGDGICAGIPSLVESQKIDLGKIKCGNYPCVEQQGLIWFFATEKDHPADTDPGLPPLFPEFASGEKPAADIRLEYPCSIDNAAFALIDPAHIAFVHKAWWMRKSEASIRPKEKHFEPVELGWKMATHKAPSESLLHKVLGGNVETDIETWLPGLRVERISGDKHKVVNLLAVTPIDPENTQLVQCIWSSMKTLHAARPLVERLALKFLDQDTDIAIKQREGLKYEPRQMLIADADAQMKWWLRLKEEWINHRREHRKFVNPVQKKTLRYRS